MRSLCKVLLLISVVAFTSSCKEDEYTTKSSICGTVIDAQNSTPIKDAIVTNLTTGKNCITLDDGCYEFTNLEYRKTYKIYVEKDGYIPSTQSITPSEVRDRIELNIRLSKRP